MAHRDVVIFDLDGTLVDSRAGIEQSFAHLCATLGLPPLERDEVRALIGPALQEIIEMRFGLEGPARDQAVQVFRDYYQENGVLEFSAMPGVDAMLAALAAAGFELCVATSKLASHARLIIDHAGWTDHFAIVGGATPDGVIRRKADVIESVLDRLADDRIVVAMIGDRPEDVSGAAAHGLASVSVAWGYTDATTLDDLETTVVETCDELVTHLGDRRVGEIS